VVGEIKYMSRGVIIIETAYSDIDFTLDWNSVRNNGLTAVLFNHDSRWQEILWKNQFWLRE